MGKSWIAVFITLSALLVLGSRINQVAVACEVGEEQECFCPEGTASNQVCRSDGSGWETCDCTTYSIWCDDTTGICWQDPQKDAYDLEDPGLTQPDALRYCDELVMGGYDNWRLPTIDEMRTVIAGNPPVEAGGVCPMTEGSSRDDMGDEACGPIASCEGPGMGGCYWIPEFTGTCCDKPDPASVGHPLEFVSSTVASDNEDWVGCVLYDNGAVSFNHIHSYADVRCVREAPTPPVMCEDGEAEACVPGETRQCTASNGKTGAQACADDGLCFGPCESTQFTPSPDITDICDQCDQIQLTIKVPEKLTVKPAQIMAFLYAADEGEWTFPPMRPPDGGTEDNQVINPDIDVDKPYEMTVPACTYYRENCIAGEYYLLVFLLNEEKMPPFPTDGEYAWGMVQEPIILGDGEQKMIEKEVTLVPCGEDTDGNGVGDACETKKTILCPAEEIYGEHSKQTELLRYIRDNVLSKTLEGREIIRLYYQSSPVIVKAMETDGEFKINVKETIDKIFPLIAETAK